MLLASGPSLEHDQLATVYPYWHRRQLRVLGCNDTYRIAPWLDFHYACDDAWWNHHHQGACALPCPNWTQDAAQRHLDCAARYGLNVVHGEYKHGLSLDPWCIHYGDNSGYQLLNLALLLGFRRVVLLGYDMTPSHSGKQHFFGQHPAPLNKSGNRIGWAKNFTTTLPDLERAGMEVVNASAQTALTCYRRENLEGALRWLTD